MPIALGYKRWLIAKLLIAYVSEYFGDMTLLQCVGAGLQQHTPVLEANVIDAKVNEDCRYGLEIIIRA